MGKIKAGSQCLADHRMLGKLFAIVRRDRMHRSLQHAEQADDGVPHSGSRALFDMRDQVYMDLRSVRVTSAC